VKREDRLKEFSARLPFEFSDTALLESVFVHASYLNERGVNERGEELLEANERLEFLGDSVLSAVISDILYERYPNMEEGELTQLRARLVNRRTLAGIARDLELGHLVLLGRGEERSGGMENPAILANTFEALLAAVYLDRGFSAVYKYVEGVFASAIEGFHSTPGHFDFKPELQELTQRVFKESPVYRVVKEQGPPHKRTFTIEAVVTGKVMGTGSAARKKDAEQIAAREALRELKSGDG
jgi:ribonuclease III